MAKQTLFVYQGTDFSTTLSLSADDGTAINIANYAFFAGVRQNPYSNYLSCNLVAIATDNANGVVTISLGAADTSNVSIGSYMYSVASKVNNNTSVILSGDMIICPNPINTPPLPANVTMQTLDDTFYALAGQNSFYLSYAPPNTANVNIIYNGNAIANNVHVYTITGQVLIFANSAAQGDVIQAKENVAVFIP